jgi:Replication-relaxation
MNEPVRRAPRPGKVSLAHVVNLGSRLTERDRQIALDCYEHHVLTTEQLQRLHFSGMRTARARLHALYKLRILDRFRPPWQRGEGSTPHHWILDEAGAHIVAELYGVDRRDLSWRHSTALALATSAKLRHHIEINEFFARLAQEAVAAGGALSEWYGERTAHQLFSGTIVPDGYGVVSLPARAPLHVLLELDRATEPVVRLRDKATRYAQAIPRSVLGASSPVIVLAVPTPARAHAAAEATADTGAPISVAVWGKASSPLEILAMADAGRSWHTSGR